MFVSYKTKREQFMAIRAQMASERASFEPLWRDCGDHILPKRPRFFVEDSNKGDRRDSSIVDTTATLAARTLRAGMMSGITSPSRPWFKLSTPDPELNEYWRVKHWLDVVTARMQAVMLKSNLYTSLPICYGDLGVFGTHSMFMEEDFKTVFRTFPQAVGSYFISNNANLQVDCFHRDFRMTVRQMVEKFAKPGKYGRPDFSNFSLMVKDAWEQASYEQWVNISHIVKPNMEFDPRKPESKYKKYESCYYEAGYNTNNGAKQGYLKDSDQDRYLSEKGYDYFPVLTPRWETNGEDVYATSWPGMDSLGDIKQLQLGEKRLMMAIDKMVNPPMKGPSSLKSQHASILPGDITFVDANGSQSFEPVYQINPKVLELENKQAQVRSRIQRGFYEDLFLMLGNIDKTGMTATEVAQRYEEKLLALGPVLQLFDQDALTPMIDLCFDFMDRQGMIPPAPEELQGVMLKVEYTSIMAQAQKIAGLTGIERFTRYVGELGKVFPIVNDKVNAGEMVDYYADVTGIPAKIINSDEQMAMIQQQRDQQQKAMQAAEMMKQGAGAARDLSQASMEGDSALTRLIQQSEQGQLVNQ